MTEAITVQKLMVMDRVMPTFYAHFQTKDDLLRAMCTDIFDHVVSDTLNIEHSHVFSLGQGAPMEIITHILYHMKDNRRNIVGVLSCESGELFLRYFKEYLNELVTNWLHQADRIPDVPRDFLLDHISGSFVNMVQYWIKNGMAQSPETLTVYFEAVIGPLLTQSPRT